MRITVTEIEQDIAEFQARIALAREKLAELPIGHLPYLAHKKREKQTRDLLAEIEHVQRLIEYAEQGKKMEISNS